MRAAREMSRVSTAMSEEAVKASMIGSSE